MNRIVNNLTAEWLVIESAVSMLSTASDFMPLSFYFDQAIKKCTCFGHYAEDLNGAAMAH